MTVEKIAMDAKKAVHEMAMASTEKKNHALKEVVNVLHAKQKSILEANHHDIDRAFKNGLNEAMIDRLSIQNRLDGILSDIEKIIQLPDPIGECIEKHCHDQLEIAKYRTPIGVLGVIYESRPNVTVDVSVLALKSGNCVILRGGAESLETNKALVEAIQEALIISSIPPQAIQLIQNSDRNEVNKMLRLHDYIDLIIPRGGASLHRFCRENSTIPVITGGIGICHLFVDESANLEKSLAVILNAKTQRPTVCNALDTVLVHEKIAGRLIPQLISLLSSKGVSFRLDERSMRCISNKNEQEVNCLLAEPADWDTEWLSLILGIKTVSGLAEATEHIIEHSTGHSDGILTENIKNADFFIAQVDSAAVYVNASTRFTDGGQLGLGSEVAISTQKLHARGPMGLKELTSYKWVIKGDYAIRN